MKIETITQAIKIISEQNEADGCQYCAFVDNNEWEMPCAKCKRNAKDYWRYKSEEE